MNEFGRWSGATVVCLASGPSMSAEDADYVRGRARVITVNGTWRRAPWADVHYSNDHDWFEAELPAMQRACTGEFWCGHPTWRHPAVRSIPFDKKARGIVRRPGRIAWGGNSGYAALNLAWQFGAKRIVMVGYDQSSVHGEHWHGEHPEAIRKGFNFPMWADRFAEAARDFARFRIEVVNCSRATTLACFPLAELEAVL